MVASSAEAVPLKNRRDFRKERESEMAAIWGSEVRGEARFPKRKGGANKNMTMAGTAGEAHMDTNDLLSDNDHEDEGSDNGEGGAKTRKDKKKLASKKALAKYRLHCFVEPGTAVNDIREVFEQYEPKVDLRTSQKGNLLNKVHYAVLTFRNKPMALHAVKKLEGTNQRDLLGVTSLKLSMCLTREQNKIARKKARRQTLKQVKANKMKEVEDEETFIKNFMASNR
ncbi:RNA-binding protein, putative [Bodo saltans]|uniref:RNA-binding protein, putative n=1 Tax=Bodo saltans TaxID=75058 RepID=A0A0S4JVA8_BODSA|nr:RNA-binding protein, putative [Bodo saltans]|eukprot:CUG94175.1 RNA-binding protein, putative [Bodo saltans]